MIPPGTTHFQVFYGTLTFYKYSSTQRVNTDLEVTITDHHIYHWKHGKWNDVGSGFSGRLLKSIDKLSHVNQKEIHEVQH